MNTQTLLRAVTRVSNKIRDYDEDMTISGMNVLLTVMEREEVPMADLVEVTGMTLAGVSRAVAVLSVHGRRTKEGIGLVELKEDPMERRRKIVYLSTEGKALATMLKKILTAACTRAMES